MQINTQFRISTVLKLAADFFMPETGFTIQSTLHLWHHTLKDKIKSLVINFANLEDQSFPWKAFSWSGVSHTHIPPTVADVNISKFSKTYTNSQVRVRLFWWRTITHVAGHMCAIETIAVHVLYFIPCLVRRWTIFEGLYFYIKQYFL